MSDVIGQCARCGRNLTSDHQCPVQTPPSELAAPLGSEALDKRIRKAVEADLQQWMIQSLTPDRGYMTPIDNVRALILELLPPNGAGELRLPDSDARKETR